MKSSDSVGITFVNIVVGRGILHGVVNFQFGTYLFGTKEDGKSVDPEPVVSCRLRMDVACAKALRDNLNELLQSVETPAGVAAVEDAGVVTNGAAKH